MITRTTRSALGALAAACLAAAGASSADPLVAAFGLEVDNPNAFVSALDQLQKSDQVRGGRMGLWAPEFSGSSTANHVLVIEYDDYAAYEESSTRRRASRDWQTFMGTIGDSTRLASSALFVQRKAAGEGWGNHNASAVFIMTVTDPAKYGPAYDRLVSAQGHPGSIRLLEVRAGGEGVTHVVVITAPGFAVLNEYLDKLLGSDDYRRFVEQVRSIRTINTVNLYRRIRSWGG